MSVEQAHAAASVIRLINGGTDPHDLQSALQDVALARIVALSDRTDETVRVAAGLAGGLPELVDGDSLFDPRLMTAVEPLIGTAAGYTLLESLARIAPAGWGAGMTRRLLDAVASRTCTRVAAAVLIGPSDAAARLLQTPHDIAQTLGRWGNDADFLASGWYARLSDGERARILDRIMTSDMPWLKASCAPFLPLDMTDAARSLIAVDSASALNAFADASVTVRRLRADLVAECIHLTRIMPQFQRLGASPLSALVRMACASPDGAGEIWASVAAIIPHRYEWIKDVLDAAPWSDLPPNVVDSLMDGPDAASAVSTVAARLWGVVQCARGSRISSRASVSRRSWRALVNGPLTPQNGLEAAVFFAALNPWVWEMMDAEDRRPWRTALSVHDSHLAVRSLGPDPEILACAVVSGKVIAALERAARDESTRRRTLLPLALRQTPVDVALKVTAALPDMPPAPGAFFIAASGDPDVSPRDRAIVAMIHDRAMLACSIALQRMAMGRDAMESCTAALTTILRDRSWDEVHALARALPTTAQTIIAPDVDDLTNLLAHPDRGDAMRQALTGVRALPPDIAAPALFALREAANPQRGSQRMVAARCAALLLAHHDGALDIADALRDDVRALFFPLPDHAPTANALQELARHDTAIAFPMAHALHDRRWRDVARWALHAPQHTRAVLQALPDAAWDAVCDDALQRTLVGDATLRAAWREFADRHPLLALALASFSSDDPVEQHHARAVLAQSAHEARAFLARMGLDITLTASSSDPAPSTMQAPRGVRR